MDKREIKILLIAAMSCEIETIVHGSGTVDIFPENFKVSNHVRRLCKLYWEPEEYTGNVAVFCCGVGGKRASKSVKTILRYVKPDMVLIAGFSGSLCDELQVFDITVIKSVSPASGSAGSLSFSEGRTRLLVEILKSLTIDFHESNCACSDVMVDKTIHRNQLREDLNAQCVDMESHYILSIIQGQGIPGAMIRIISDNADESLGLNFEKIPNTKWAARIYFFLHPKQYFALRKLQKASKKLGSHLNGILRKILPNMLHHV